MADIRDQLKAAIYGQESSSGKADTSKPNYAGAQGPMQVTGSTFEGLKASGVIPQDWQLSNPEQAKEAGNRLVDQLMDLYQDDPRKAAAAYYAGPKAVNDDGTINDFHDLKNPKAPGTHAYVNQVMGRMGADFSSAGNSPVVGTAAPVPAGGWINLPSIDPNTGRVRTGRALKETKDVLQPDAPLVVQGDPIGEQLAAQAATEQTRTAQIQATGVIDSARAQYPWNGLAGDITRALADTNNLHPAVPGFDPRRDTPSLYDGLDEAGQMDIDQAKSPQEAELRRIHQDYRTSDMQQAALGGTANMVMGQLIGGVPEGAVTGFAVSRLFAGVRAAKTALAVRDALKLGPQTPAALAAIEAAGQPATRAAKLLSSFGEQAVGNYGSLATQSALGDHISPEDWWMATGFSVLGAGLDGLGWHPRDAEGAANIGQKVMDDAAAKKAATQAQAVANVGEDATPEQLRAEVNRLEGAELTETQKSATTVVPDNRRLMPDPEEVTRQVQEEHEATLAENGGQPTLPKDLAGAAPRYSAGKDSYELKFANDLDRAAYIVSGKGKSAAHDKFVKWAADAHGLMEDELLNHGAAVREQIKAQALEAEPGTKRLNVEEVAHPDTGTAPATSDKEASFPTIVPDMIPEEPVYRTLPEDAAKWADPGVEARRRDTYMLNKDWRDKFAMASNGKTLDEIDALPHGLHVQEDIASLPHMRPVIEALQALHKQFLPNSRVTLALDHVGGKQRGQVMSFGDTHAIAIRENVSPSEALTTGIHEFGHAIFHQTAKDIPNSLIQAMAAEFRGNMSGKGYTAHAMARFHEGADHIIDPNTGELRTASSLSPQYLGSFDEYTAENFVKQVQKAARDMGLPIELPKGAESLLKAIWNKVKAVYDWAHKKGWLPKDEAFNEYFGKVLAGDFRGEKAPTAEVHEGGSLDDFPEFSSMDIPSETGIDIMPEATVQQRAEKRMLASIVERADTWNAANPVDTSRLSKLLKNTVFDPASSVMLRSTNPVMRMIAGELLENGAGAAGRRYSAALGKWLMSRKMMGNSINDYQRAYTQWRNAQGGNVWGDYRDGELKKQFDRLVAMETESRQQGRAPIESPEQVKAAADVMRDAYERARLAQVQSKTTGWASLPETSEGYMPHRMSRERVLNLSVAEKQALWSNLTDQFQSIEGFDPSFSANLAGKYIERVERAALGGYDAPGGIHQTGAAEVVEEALQSMGLSRDEVRAQMQRYMAAGPGHTKRRLRLDLTQQFDDGKGGSMQLMDLFNTDQLQLLRQQVDRVSGEVALTQHGVYGKAGLALIREAARHGRDGQKATEAEFRAFDQMAAEFMGTPFGTATGKWADRAMQFNSLARLGGMGIQQVAESINGIFHVGAGRTLESVLAMPRLRAEAKALAAGEKVDNPILTSLETFGGAEFGTDHYKMVFPFGEDTAGNELRVYGKDSTFMADRLLRGATHMQGKLSFWRAISAAQYRGMGEQIVHKAMKFVRDGSDDIALNDMGIHASLRAKLREELPNIAQFDPDGRLKSLDITKIKDTAAGLEFVAAVHRGVGQIIQNEHIGEKGVWAHSGLLRILTQFRTFSITSIEKQWGRQVGNHGTAAAFGMLMGGMSIAAPIYIARTYVNSLGQKDPQAYLDRQLTATNIARATLNYISMSGLAGDFMDATSAVTGLGQSSGGRTGTGKNLIGDTVAPAAGELNDLYQGIQNTKNGTDPHQLMKAMPFANLPYLAPAVNALASKMQTSTAP